MANLKEQPGREAAKPRSNEPHEITADDVIKAPARKDEVDPQSAGEDDETRRSPHQPK